MTTRKEKLSTPCEIHNDIEIEMLRRYLKLVDQKFVTVNIDDHERFILSVLKAWSEAELKRLNPTKI